MVIEGSWWYGVAAILREEDRDGIVFRTSLKPYIARSVVVRRRPTPLVAVECIEIQSLRSIRTTDDIVLQIRSKIGRVGGRVSNGDIAVTLCFTVILEINRSREEVRCGTGVGI